MFLELLEKIKQTKETSEQVKIFYHVTPLDNLDLIRKEGLKAGSFITDSLEDAESMRDFSADVDEIQATIIELRLTAEQRDKLTVDENQPNAYQTHEMISVQV